jgi:hypothetical protein
MNNSSLDRSQRSEGSVSLMPSQTIDRSRVGVTNGKVSQVSVLEVEAIAIAV